MVWVDPDTPAFEQGLLLEWGPNRVSPHLPGKPIYFQPESFPRISSPFCFLLFGGPFVFH